MVVVCCVLLLLLLQQHQHLLRHTCLPSTVARFLPAMAHSDLEHASSMLQQRVTDAIPLPPRHFPPNACFRARARACACAASLRSAAAAAASAGGVAARAVRRAPAVATRAVLADAPAAAKGEGCPRGAHWAVHKFGGTCMASAERIRGAARLIIDDAADSKVVVVSAMGSTKESPIKVTDLILNMVAKAAKQDAAFLVDLASLQEKHVTAAKELLGDGPLLSAFISRLLEDIGNLKAMLQAICIGEREWTVLSRRWRRLRVVCCWREERAAAAASRSRVKGAAAGACGSSGGDDIAAAN